MNLNIGQTSDRQAKKDTPVPEEHAEEVVEVVMQPHLYVCVSECVSACCVCGVPVCERECVVCVVCASVLCVCVCVCVLCVYEEASESCQEPLESL